MAAEEKNKNEILSRIAADLFVKSPGGEELPSKINRLRDELRKVIESEDTLFGKFRGLVESFREIIPDEKQRYNAAIKALSTTSKINPQDIVKAINNQVEELKILEKVLFSAPSGWRDELKVVEARSREIKDEISKLRERIVLLESEEKEILNNMATRERDTELVSKAVGELFGEITAEIASINKKVAEVAAESAAPQPILPSEPMKSDIFPLDRGGSEQKIEILEPAAPQDRGLQKRCPMCGGRMDFYGREGTWRCYSCAYEELEEKKQGSEQTSEIRESSAPEDTELLQKKCPMCGGRMDFYSIENLWRCFSCAHEEPKEGAAPETNAPKPSPPIAVPLADMPLNTYQEPKKRSSLSHSQPPSKKKPCPACHKRMSWYDEEKTWRCPFCGYERSI